MGEDFNNSEMRYAMRDVLGGAEFAEAARAFSFAGITSDIVVSPLVLATNNPAIEALAADEPSISEQDITQLIAQIVASAGTNTDPSIVQFIKDAQDSVGSPRSSLAALRDAGLRMAENAKTNMSDANAPETNEQKISRLLGEIKEIDDNQRKRVEEMMRTGEISQETGQRYLDALDRANDPDLVPGSPEWTAAQNNLQQQHDHVVDDIHDRTNGQPSPTGTAFVDDGSRRADMVKNVGETIAAQRQAELAESTTQTLEFAEHTPIATQQTTSLIRLGNTAAPEPGAAPQQVANNDPMLAPSAEAQVLAAVALMQPIALIHAPEVTGLVTTANTAPSRSAAVSV